MRFLGKGIGQRRRAPLVDALNVVQAALLPLLHRSRSLTDPGLVGYVLLLAGKCELMVLCFIAAPPLACRILVPLTPCLVGLLLVELGLNLRPLLRGRGGGELAL